MDIEGYARRMLLKEMSDKEVIEKLSERISEIKGWDISFSKTWAKAVILEVKYAISKSSDVLQYYNSGVKMGEFGVGSRGKGDFYVHKKISEVIGENKAAISSKDLDDAGVIKCERDETSLNISVAIDGIHSRLSEFPFISGFHVTRAAMRDIYVMGTEPVAVFSDIHIADDGDVSKIFDHIAGISSVCDLTDIPFVSGSTLRIGGDMVIGERMTGGVGCIGVGKVDNLTARRNAVEGDVILLSEGAGGGTIATTAIYYGMHEIVEETLNIDFIKACKSIFNLGLLKEIHSMTDVTNGGIRGDATEISSTSKKSLVFDFEKVRRMVNPRVLEMLEELKIDFMGLSIDSLMIICPQNVSDSIIKAVKNSGVRIEEVGYIRDGKESYIIEDGFKRKLEPKFRESAYTPLKKVVGEVEPPDFEDMRKRVDIAVKRAIAKKEKLINQISNKN